MAARAYWQGQIRLALVSIPVEIYSATRSGASISFHQIHEPTGKRIKYEKVAPGVGPVDPDEIVKGYEISKGNYVLLDDEEVEAAKVESKRTLELVQFVDASDVDVLYYDKPYFVIPADDLAEEAYVVMRDALKQTRKVGIGQLSTRFRPTDYLAATRSEVETTVLPGQWDELGVSFTAFLGRIRATAQVVNGLDSTGFSSAAWVGSGHQGAFETIRATDLAVVGRLDVTAARGIEIGAATYAGGTSKNRPKPDLVIDCPDGDPEEVASCGYVSAPVVITELDAHVKRGPVRGSALALWGWLGNSDDVTERNRRLSNDLGAPRTPVASQAYGLSIEAGVDIGPWVGVCPDNALEPFVRVERYDTMFRTATGVFDNPRYQRTVYTGGAALTLAHHLTFKLDVAHRRYGATELRAETTVNAVAGFVY